MSTASGAMGEHHRSRLHSEAQRIGNGTVDGRLYDLGSYPGLVIGERQGGLVHGEVLRLQRPAVTLGWLDDYECVTGRGKRDPYVRRLLPVTVDGGQTITAWAYVYQRPVPLWRQIEAGRWTS